MELGQAPLFEAGYAERDESPQPLLARFWGELGFQFHSLFSRDLAHPERLASGVAHHAKRMAAGSLAPRVPELRYQMRRAGIRLDLVAECFGLYEAALAQRGLPPLSPEALGTGLVMLQGGIAEHTDPAARAHGLGLAAAVRAIGGTPVHLLAANAPRARYVADAIGAPLESMGIPLGRVMPETSGHDRRAAYAAQVVCGPYRELATDYLRDRLHMRRMRGRLTVLLDHLSGDTPRDRLMLAGLHCALVADADMVMLDDALVALSISAAADESQSRLLYEQALELARALEEGADFLLDAAGARLTAGGAERLARLVTPLGDIWAAPRRRDELIVTALDGLYVLERGRDYRVEQGRVVFPEPEEADAAEDAASIEVLRRLVEIKEGCRGSGRRDVLARISLPRFFNRYLHLAGVCHDARGAERELWKLYRRHTVAVGPRESAPSVNARVFSTGAAKWTAVIESARAAQAGGCVIAVRSPDEAQVGLCAFEQTGMQPALIRGVGDEAERLALLRAGAPGGIALVVFPAERTVLRDAGGVPVHMIVAELRGTRREVTQLLRAFVPTSFEMMLSLEDKAVEPHLKRDAAETMRSGEAVRDELPARSARRLAARLQRRAEHAQSMARLDILSRDDYVRDLLALAGTHE